TGNKVIQNGPYSGLRDCFRFLKRVWTYAGEREHLFDQTEDIHDTLSKAALEKANGSAKRTLARHLI
ncbi:MAG: hypothetical protein LRY43_02760, partial [Gammaproteobacteria bacterium]|nr:hypothetical protein [Gammaproteobacteria bacterium]